MIEHVATLKQSLLLDFANIGKDYSIRPDSVSYSMDSESGFVAATVVYSVPAHMGMFAADTLGSHLEIHTSHEYGAWEGFVDSIEVTVGGMTLSIGAITTMSNAIKLRWRGMTWNTNPPIYTGDRESEYAYSYQSIATYGRLEEIVAVGELDEERAAEVLVALLNTRPWPTFEKKFGETDRKSSLGRATITLNCKGYAALFEKRHWIATNYNGYVDIAQKIADAVSVFGNLFDASGVMFMDTLVERYVETNVTVKSIIDACVEEANTRSASAYGVRFGVYNNRLILLQKVEQPNAPDYYIDGSTGKLLNQLGGIVKSGVRPGDWVGVSNAGYFPSTHPQHGRMMFPVGSVEYSDGVLTINEMKYGLIDRYLEERGV